MRAGLAAGLLAFAGIAAAQEPVPQGEPVAAERLRDAEFGVSTRQFGLQRRVEMLQWRRQGAGYARVWTSEPVDSSGFDARHANPGAFPIETRYWIAPLVTVDGRPVDEDVLKALGQWRGFRPGFSALPGNLSATFQPEGDGLGSAENPLDPQIGDLRITWHEMTLPPLAGRVALRNAVWVLKPGAAVADAGAAPARDPALAGRETAHRYLLPVGAGALLVFALLALIRRRRGTRRRH